MRSVKTEICRVLLVLEVVFCAVLLSAIVQGTLPILTALVYAGVSICGVDWLCRVLLPRRMTKRTASPASLTAETCEVIQVVAGGRAA